jgi:hypothetical protein
MNRVSKNKLTLNREFIRTLSPYDLKSVAGGAMTSNCDSATHMRDSGAAVCVIADTGNGSCVR